jgi:hypothetical protein
VERWECPEHGNTDGGGMPVATLKTVGGDDYICSYCRRDMTLVEYVLASELREAMEKRERLGRRVDQLEASAKVAQRAIADVMRQITTARDSLGAEIQMTAIERTQAARDAEAKALGFAAAGDEVTQAERRGYCNGWDSAVEHSTTITRAGDVVEAAKVYFREFDALIGSRSDRDYPERIALRETLAAWERSKPHLGGKVGDESPTPPMAIISYNGEIVATVSRRSVFLTGPLADVSIEDPRARFVYAMASYARDIATGELAGPYAEGGATLYARTLLIPDDEFDALAQETNEALAERFRVPLEQIALKREDLRATRP